jgi:hypothetical protein
MWISYPQWGKLACPHETSNGQVLHLLTAVDKPVDNFNILDLFNGQKIYRN